MLTFCLRVYSLFVEFVTIFRLRILTFRKFFFFSPQVNHKDVYLSYLPLAHIFDRVIEELFILHGASIGFWRGVRMLSYNSSLKSVYLMLNAIIAYH